MRCQLSALVAFLLTTSYVPGAAQDRSVSFVSTSSELVVLPVIVSNKRGGFVSDLPQARFNVFDNGRRQEVALFSNEDTPVTVGLVIDSSGSMKAKLPEVIVAATTFERRSNPQDEMFVVAFNDTVIRAGCRRRPASNRSNRICERWSRRAERRSTMGYQPVWIGCRLPPGRGKRSSSSATVGTTPAIRRSIRS